MSDILDTIFAPLPMVELFYPNEAKKKVLAALTSASENLGDVSTALKFAEFFAEPDIASKLSGYGETIDEFAGKLALPGTLIKNFQAAMKIKQAISGLKGKISDNPQAAARSFGKLFSGIGELARYFPIPIASSYLEIFAEAENFFVNLQTEIVPHTRGTHKRIDEKARQHGEDRSLFSQP